MLKETKIMFYSQTKIFKNKTHGLYKLCYLDRSKYCNVSFPFNEQYWYYNSALFIFPLLLFFHAYFGQRHYYTSTESYSGFPIIL